MDGIVEQPAAALINQSRGILISEDSREAPSRPDSPLEGILDTTPTQKAKSAPEGKPAGKALSRRLRISAQASAFMPVMSMDAALARRAAIVEFTRKIMVRDQDFGEIPGTKKPALLKPGAEKLCNFFGLEPEFTPVADEVDWTGERHNGEPFCYARYQCRLHRHGRVLGVGEGSCNSWEQRYRYRWVTAEHLREDLDREQLPKRGGKRTLCEFEFAIDRGETTGAYSKPAEHWIQFREAIRAGKARRVERDSRQGKLPAWEIDVDTTLYRIPNPDIADVVNTIQKMAQKRALIAATLIATSASEFFTQDVEDRNRDSLGVSETDTPMRAGAGQLSGGSEAGNGERKSASVYDANAISKPWKNFGQMRHFFEKVRERVGETQYFEELRAAGVESPAQFRSANKALACYTRLVRIAAEAEVA